MDADLDLNRFNSSIFKVSLFDICYCSLVLLNLSFISFNARGLRCNNKRKALFLFAKQFRVDFGYIQEAHSVKDDAKFWTTQWGNSLWFSHGSEHSAGVITLRNRFNGEVLQSVNDPDGHFVCLLLTCNDFFIIAVNLYGYNRKPENDNLLKAIENILKSWLEKYPRAYIIMGGDFNIVQDCAVDKWPPGRPKSTDNTLKKLYGSI